MTTKGEIFMMQQQNEININEELDFVENFVINRDDLKKDNRNDMKKRFSRIKSKFGCRRSEGNYKVDVFIGNTLSWLNTTRHVREVSTVLFYRHRSAIVVGASMYKCLSGS